MTKLGTVIDGKYEILREIGKGGMSVVYLAMDTHLNKQWAVKEIRKKGSGRNDEIVINSLLAEANLMKRLDHPSLPRIVDIIDNGVTIYVVMDYIEGESLDKILAEYGAQPEELVINWAKQLCDALSYLHSQKPPIIYRDMKPANVMLKPEGNIKIIDFGIAREYKEQNLADTTVLGTKGYAPPEQYSGQTDNRSDIFALGMTMHHLLTGVDPRNGEPYAPVRRWNPELSEGIELIIDKCVQPAPENRYQNCGDLLYDLEHPDYITRGFKKRQRRRLNAFIAAAVLCVVMCISGFACRIASTQVKNNNYDQLVSAVGDVESYKRAIEIYPERTDAYMKMLEYYEETKFGEAENAKFLPVLNRYKDQIDSSSREAAELNYKLGLMYFNYFKREEGVERKASDYINMAYPYFEANAGNENLSPEFEEKELCECYYRICRFYKEYILPGASVKEASKNDFETLFQEIRQTIENIKNEGAYDQLVLYSGTANLLYDQRNVMKSVGIEKEAVLALLEEVYSKAKETSPSKEQTRELWQEIMENYEQFRNAISSLYDAPVEDVEGEDNNG